MENFSICVQFIQFSLWPFQCYIDAMQDITIAGRRGWNHETEN